MTVLHVQTRAYPTYHRGLSTEAVGALSVPGWGDIRVLPGSLGSLVYGDQATLEIDLTEPLRAATAGWEAALADGEQHLAAWAPSIEWSRLRVLGSSVVLFSTAVTYQGDLADRGLHDVCDIDAAVNRVLRRLDRPLLAAAFDALFQAGVLHDPRPSLDRGAGGATALVGSAAVRYNCHLVGGPQQWVPDGGAPVAGCTALLPYTYAWTQDDPSPDVLLRSLEPLDLVVAQRSVLAAASDEALRVLERLHDQGVAELDVEHLRRHLDRVRISYHRLDAYRYDSAQRDRELYFSARAGSDLDAIYQSTELVMAQAAESLQAAVTARTAELDGRLNRLAAIFTVAASGAFILQVVEFADGGERLGQVGRWVTLGLVAVASATVLAVSFWRSLRRPERAQSGSTTS